MKKLSDNKQASCVYGRINFVIVLWACFMVLLNFEFSTDAVAEVRTVRVGVYNFPPLVFEDNGVSSGLFVDIVREVAKSEGWELSYKPGSWSECLSRLESGEIDLLPAIAFSEGRALYFDYTEVPVVLDWGVLFKRNGDPINRLTDLNGKTVAVLRGAAVITEFKKLLAQFNVDTKIVYKDDLDSVFHDVKSGYADVAVSTQIVGNQLAYKYGLVSSDIIFSPVKLFFATKKGSSPSVISSLDSFIANSRASKESVVNRLKDKWIEPPAEWFPVWILWVLVGLFAIVVLLLLFLWLLRSIVRSRTCALIKSNDELMQSEQWRRFALDAAKAGTWEWNMLDNTNVWSSELYSLYGLEPGSVEPSFDAWIETILPEDRAAASSKALSAAKDGAELNIEWRVNSAKDCAVRWLMSRGRPQFDSSGKLIRYIGLVIDYTDKKAGEELIVQAKEQALSALRVKAEFLANMSHEIRTPLNGILGMLQLLETTDQNEEQKEYILGAIQSTNRLNRLLSDILDISRIEAGKMQIVETEFNIKKIRNSIKELFSIEARGKGLGLEFGRDEDLPLVLIGDEVRLRQILFNLVGNAIKFTEKGEVRIDASMLPSSSNSLVRVLITVSDTGIGIPEEHLKDIFEPFVQAEGSYTRRFQGAGLGLSIVRRLVKLLGGEIAIDSTLGEGTTVYLSLPFKLPKTEQNSVAIPVNDSSSPGRGPSRILLAEDDSISSITCKRMLEKSGYSVTSAKDGREALQLLTEKDFDLILMDVQMPVMDGVEATRAIRDASNLGAKSSIPIIAMTAYAMSGDKGKFLAAGMDEYIAKPVDNNELIQLIERVLSGRGGSQ